MTVAVLGDANVDLEIRLPRRGGPPAFANPEPRLFGGGSAANTAAALARLGVATRFGGAVGDDGFGRFAVESLTTAGVDTSSVAITREAPTVVVAVVVNPEGDRLIYVWPPSGGAHALLDSPTAATAAQGAEWLHVSGIALRVEPARETIMSAMAQARVRRVPVSLDLNLRLENWGWDGGFLPTITEACRRADVILGAGRDEICQLANEDDPMTAAAALAVNRIVVARLGPDGAVACTDGESARSPAFPVAVVDTVGAGDAFNAGFIAARLGGAGLSEALRWGNGVAAVTVSTAGARSTPTREELRAFLS